MFNSVQEDEIVLRFTEVTTAELVDLVDGFDGDVTFQAVEFTLPGGTTIDGGDVTDATPEAPARSPARVRPDADPFYVLQTLADADGWLPSTELRTVLPEGNGINTKTLSNTLWRLDHRGLVESRQHEADGRVREYRISEEGTRAFEAAQGSSNGETSATSSGQPSVQAGGDPYHLLDVLADEDDWMTTDAMLETISAEVNRDSLSSTLWRMADRGLVETRPLAEDNRYKEYRATDAGEAALARATGGTDASEVAANG